MDYEKKYNEALERARKIYDEIVNNEVIGFPGQITDIFPELAESEDERIINGLLAVFDDGRSGKWGAMEVKDIVIWLKKQKESLHIEKTCKEKAGSFTDEDEDRTINGCLLAANAECRCKRASEELLEELGLADYTKFFYEQGVEKGKKEREKQKEQKEIPLMNGDADLYFDEWNQQKPNPTKRQCFEEGMKYAQRLQKEQTLTEWSEFDKGVLEDAICAAL